MPANIVVPEVGESIVDARVAKWLRREGEVVAVGDPLVELETDKIDLEVSAPQAGVLTRIDRKDGEDVKVGEVLGVIDDAASSATAGASGSAQPGARSGAPPSGAADPSAGEAKGGAEKTRATPTARNAAEDRAVDLSRVRGTGDAGRVMRRDVEQVAAGGGNGSGAAASDAPKSAPGPE